MLDKPDEDVLVRALEKLHSLKIIDEYSELTSEIGIKVADIPLDPVLAVMLLNSFQSEYACSKEILKIVAMLSVQNNIFHMNQEPPYII